MMVSYKYKQIKKWPEPTYIVNNKFIVKNIGWINPSDIVGIKVSNKKDTTILGVKPPYMLITLKDSIPLKMISLEGIKKKYIKSISPYCIYQINGSISTLNAEECLINENSILSISVDKIKSKDSTTGKGIEIEVLEILTDTKENVRKSKEIIIR